MTDDYARQFEPALVTDAERIARLAYRYLDHANTCATCCAHPGELCAQGRQWRLDYYHAFFAAGGR